MFGTVLNTEELQEALASLPGIAAHVVDVREEATIQEAARRIGEELGALTRKLHIPTRVAEHVA